MLKVDKIFLAYDIRGKNITTHEAFLVGRAIGSFFTGTCFVGRDSRETSPQLAEHLIEGLRSSGINVTVGGLMPGPACYYKTMGNFDFGVYVTASHLPPEYNGFKIILRDGSSIDPSDLQKISSIFANFDFKKEEPVPVKEDITALNDYCRFLEKTFGRKNVKCIIDCFNGATSVISKRVFSMLLDAKTINDAPLPDFGGKDPEPSKSNLKMLQQEVLRNNALFGVGLDGDGDRSVFVDEKGNVIDGNRMTMLFAKHLLLKHKGVIVAPVSISRLLETKIVRPLGGKVVWCKVGHTFIEKELLRNNAIFGGEFSCHFYWNEFFPYSDGIFSSLMLAKILSETGKTLSELLSELPQVYVVKGEVEFPSHNEKERVASILIQKYLKAHPDALTMDGIKFKDSNAYILIRPSMTRHTVKVFVEAENEELAKAKLEEYISIVQSIS